MDMQKTGLFIQKSRQLLNMSQRELGEYLLVTDKAVSKWERGIACPDIENLKSMALLFNCKVAEIIDGTRRNLSASSNLPHDIPQTSHTDQDYSDDINVEFNLHSHTYISPLLFGDNLEHTRDCVNGGISAQMLKNRKFAGKPGRYGCAVGWYMVGEKAYYSFGNPYTRHADNYKMKRSLECNSQVITNYHEQTVGIGQKELFLKQGERYEFRIVAKVFSPTVLLIKLSGLNGSMYDSKEILFETNEFCQKEVILIPNSNDSNANLEITFSSIGSVALGAVSLMPCDNFHGMRRDVIAKMKEIGMKLLRWPGGNFAGDYNWMDGLLPCDQRAPFRSFLGLETQPHTWGYDYHEISTDDFIALCREIDAEPFITINPTWNTPTESAQWVEYCNGDENTKFGALRAKRGHKEPYNVQFWSLGNEFGYGHMEGANTPYDYSKTVMPHAEKMLEVSHEITLCSSGPYPNIEWINHAAKVLDDVSPVVSMHYYANYPEFIDPAKREEEYYKLIDEVYLGVLPRITEFRELLNDENIKISFDEWNAWCAWYRGGSVAEGIYAASFLNMLFQNADKCGVSMAAHFESVNEGAMQVYPDHVQLTPTGQVFTLMKHHVNGMICASEKDVIATRKGSVLTCTLLNRSYREAKKFILPVVGEVILSNVYSSEDIVPNTVFVQNPLPVDTVDNTLEISLPAHSIAIVQINLST